MKDINKTYDKYASGTLYSTERNEYLYPEKEGKTESETVKDGVVCNAKFVRVRSSMKVDPNNIVLKLPEGTHVKILKELSGFYQIVLPEYPEKKLYIFSDYCKEV